MRHLMNHSDRRLVEVIDHYERYEKQEGDEDFKRFAAIRELLSVAAWNAFSEAIGCDSGPISKTGVAVIDLNKDIGEELLSALLASPKTDLRPDDYVIGYGGTPSEQCRYLSRNNQYREVSANLLSVIGKFLAEYGAEIERQIGHPWRVASIRPFELLPRDEPTGRHFDGWPRAFRKIFVLPAGAGGRMGTTWFNLRDNRQLTVESEQPVAVIFENSTVQHVALTRELPRPTIEIDIIPAASTDLSPTNPGLAACTPYFPSAELQEVCTRLALSAALDIAPKVAEPRKRFWAGLFRR